MEITNFSGFFTHNTKYPTSLQYCISSANSKFDGEALLKFHMTIWNCIDVLLYRCSYYGSRIFFVALFARAVILCHRHSKYLNKAKILSQADVTIDMERISPLKRQSHEIFDVLFFRQTSSPRPLFHTLKCFRKYFEFKEIFKLEVNSAVSLTPLSQKNLLRQPPFFKLLPQRRRVGKF